MSYWLQIHFEYYCDKGDEILDFLFFLFRMLQILYMYLKIDMMEIYDLYFSSLTLCWLYLRNLESKCFKILLLIKIIFAEDYNLSVEITDHIFNHRQNWLPIYLCLKIIA